MGNNSLVPDICWLPLNIAIFLPFFKAVIPCGAWSVKGLTLGFGSGLDLMDCEIKLRVGFCAYGESACKFFLSLSYCPSSLSLSNKKICKNK